MLLAASTVESAVDTGEGFVDSVRSGVTEFFEVLFGFLPNVVGFLFILAVGWFIARLIASAAERLFRTIRLDHYLDRAGLGGPLERAGYADSGRFVAKILGWVIKLLVLKLAFATLGIDALNEPFDQLIAWIPKALVAIILIIVGGLVANMVRQLVAGITGGQSYSNFVTNAAGIGVWMIFGLAALDQAQIAGDLVDTLTTAIFGSLSAIMIIKFGVGGIWAARDRFWPGVYDTIGEQTRSTPPQG